MGGNAFTNGPDALETPRMPPSIYELTRSACAHELKTIFREVRTPTPGPMKADYGDVDFIVSHPVGYLEGYDPSKAVLEVKCHAADRISWALNAVKTIHSNAPFLSANFAVPWPGREQDIEAIRQEVGPPPPFDAPITVCWLWRKRRDKENHRFLESSAAHGQKYIQVDVRVCETKEEHEWLYFKHSHGPFWQIVGSILRPFGLVVDERGMAVMIPEIEHHNKRVAKVYLSSKPGDTMEALGLPYETFAQGPFPSEHHMFEYITQCRFFWVRPRETLAVQPHEGGPVPSEAAVVAKRAINSDGPFVVSSRKQSPRKDAKTAPAIERWHEDFVPSLREEDFHRKQPPMSRDEVLAEMLTKFGMQAEHDKRVFQFLRDQRSTTITRLVRSTFPPLDATQFDQNAIMHRGALVKALIRILNHEDKTFGIVPPQGFSDMIGDELEKCVMLFIEENKEEIGEKAMAASKERMRAAMARKREASEKGNGQAFEKD